MDFFGGLSGSLFLGESSIVALYANLFKKLGKSEIKNGNLHSNLSNKNNNLPKG